MPVLSNAASLKVGARQAAKVMLGGAMVWEFYTWEIPANPTVFYSADRLTVTPNETANVYRVNKLYPPQGLYFSSII